jgi:hypothetical protein
MWRKDLLLQEGLALEEGLMAAGRVDVRESSDVVGEELWR